MGNFQLIDIFDLALVQYTVVWTSGLGWIRIRAHRQHLAVRYPGQLITTPIEMNRNDASYMKAIRNGIEKEHPDALFLSNGSLAIGAFSALNKLGLQSGCDLKVLCFDNVMHLAPIYQCRFDCVLMPFEEMARDVVDYLPLKLKQPDTPLLQKIYPVQIVQANPETNFSNGE
jgi:DNA-binding LacI/PurR family transcriptional regulator